MSGYFNILSFDPTWSIIISILLLVLFAYLFHKDKFGTTFLGFLRILASIFYSPIIYFKKLFDSVNLFGEKGEKEFADNSQYLLNKFLLIIKGVWIVISVLILGSGLVSSWNSFLPPEYLRNQITDYERQIHQLDSTNQTAKAELDKLESDWNKNSQEFIKNYKNKLQGDIDRAAKENIDISNTYANDGLFNTINNFLNQNSGTTNDYYLQNYKDQVITHVNYNSNDENTKQTFIKYAENWYIVKSKTQKLSNINNDEIRAELQPTFTELKNQNDNYNSIKKNYELTLDNIKKEAKYDFTNLLVGILTTIISFILFLWFVGILTEMIFLVVDMAGNIKEIKTIASNVPQKENESINPSE